MEERAPSEKKFDDVKKDIATDLVKENKAKELAKAAAQKALDALKAGQALETQFPKQEKPEKGAPPLSPEEQKKPHTVVTDDFHPNGGSITGAGSVPKVSAVAFSLGADKRVPENVIEDQGAFWVIELKSRKRADLSKLVSEKDALSESIANTKRTEQRKLWVEKLRKEAKIEENQDFLSYDRKVRSSAAPEDDS
jgi:peptidyl-prolyl cis-trans isomerase D